MTRRIKMISFICMIVLISAIAIFPDSPGQPVITISGLVQKPLSLSLKDLAQFNATSVRAIEVLADKTFNGAFTYRGVPLTTLLDLAAVQKHEAGYSKPIDLAIIIKNARGQRTVLSWGEVFYRNPSDAVLAVLAEPVMPMKSCGSCHAKGSYEKWETPLHRQVGFPKLLLPNDFYADRCIEDVTSIEVVDPLSAKLKKEVKENHSDTIIIRKKDAKDIVIENLSRYRRIEIEARHAGEGRGYHGIESYGGASLKTILAEHTIKPGMHSLLVFSAPDGYRSVISFGELAASHRGGDIIIADTRNGQTMQKDGKFNLILPHDLSSDRWVKALEKIEIIEVKPDPKLYIIGVGCGDADLITMSAVSAMARADMFACTDDIRERFAPYMGNKPLLFDPLESMPNYYRKKNPKLTDREIKKHTGELRAKNIETLKDALRSGKSIGFLDYGDPTIYGSWTYWILQNFREGEYAVIPGVSAFNAANAMIGKNVAVNGSVILTVPNGITNNEALVRAAAEKGETLAIFVGLSELKSLMPIFNRYYAPETPVRVVYKAGYKNGSRLVKTDLSKVLTIVESDDEKHLGMIYIGPAL